MGFLRHERFHEFEACVLDDTRFFVNVRRVFSMTRAFS